MADDFDEDDIQPPQASELSAKQLVEELERRGLKPTGFPEDDIKKLQKSLNEEFESERAEKVRERKEAIEKRRAEEDAQRLQKFLEKSAREEAEALQSDPRANFLADLARHNATPAEMVLRAAPCAVRAFIRILASCTSLQYLEMCNCKLGDDVGAEIGAMLKTNTALRVLELDFNRFGPRTASALGQGLDKNSTLRRLSLNGCKLAGEEANKQDHSGIAALATSLSNNTGLVSLSVFRCGLGSAGGHLLLEGLQGNTSLQGLAVDPLDGVTAADCAEIAEILRSNAEAHAVREVEGKKARAAARRAALQKIEAALLEEKAKAEVEWIGAEMDARRVKREEDRIDRLKKISQEEHDREKREKERWARMKAEEAEAAKKKKK